MELTYMEITEILALLYKERERYTHLGDDARVQGLTQIIEKMIAQRVMLLDK